MSNKKNPRLTRRASGLMALEPRFMFDGAAVDTAHDQLADTAALDRTQAVNTNLFRLDASNSNLTSAAQLAQQQVREYLVSSTDAQLFALFNGGKSAPDESWTGRLNSLREALSNGSFAVNVVAMDRASQFTALAAFAEHGPNGEPTIFINTFWFGMFDAPDATRALVEELGHAFDAYLNPNADSGGDEGESFAGRVIDGTLSQAQSAALLTQNDHGQVMVNGVTYEVEFASLNFSNAYEMVYDQDNDSASTSVTTSAIDVSERWADKEQNSHFFNSSAPLGVTSMTDGTNGQTFSGNDVSGAVSVTIGGATYYGWISRPIKSNGIVRGFYFWTDNDFTTLTAAQNDGNQDRGVGDPGSLDNRGFLLVVDQTWFDEQIASTGVTKTINNNKDGNDGTITVANVGSSSDRVDAALNSVLPPNSPPAAANDTLTVAEDSGTTTVSAANGLLSNDSDANNDDLTITGYTISGVTGTQTVGSTVTISGVGDIRINADGSYTFSPVANYTGSVPPITYTVSDGNGGTATAVLSITVTPVNDAPTASPDAKTISENTVASGTVIANDTDPDGDGLTVTGFTYSNGTSTVTGTMGSSNTITLNGVTVGTLTLNANGTYSFTPASNYSGTVPVFNYAISDGHGGTASSTLTISLTNLNNAPAANPDNADGTLFAQAPGCSGGIEVAETAQTGNVLTNDTDPDVTLVAGTTHQVTAVSSSTGNTWNGTAISGKYGVLTIGANGAYSYNVNENNADVKALASGATLTESFGYTVSEIGNSPNLTASSTLRIVIQGANNPPVAVNDYDTIIEAAGSGSPTTYGSVSGNVTTNDLDVDSASFSVSRVAGPSTTTFTTGNWPGNINSVANRPSDVDTVQVSTDGTNFTTLYSGTTKVLVNSFSGSGQNVGVVFTDGTPLSDFASANPTATITIRLKVGADNYDGRYLSESTTAGSSTAVTSSVAGTITGQYGSLTLASDGSYTYTLTSNALNAGQTYQERFTYTVTDSNGCSSTATLYIVANGTTTLVMDDEAVTTAEDTTLSVAVGDSNNLLTGDSGFGGTKEVTAFTWGGTQGTIGSALTKDGVGSLTINANGSYSFTPASNYSGPVPDVLYTASDGTTSGQAVLKITITPANDASLLATDSNTIPEDGSGSGNVLDNDSDTDNLLTVASYSWNNGSGTSTGTVGSATSITSGGVTVGSLTLNSNGLYTFTPAANWNGTVPTITYTTNTGSTSTLDITVTPINDPPTLDLDSSGAGTGWSVTYTNQGTAVSIGDTDVTIADVDDTNIENATVVLTNPQSGDALNFNASALLSTYGITATSSSSGGVITITLTGSSSLSNYQSALEAITFSSTGTSTVDRVISVKVNDGSADSNIAYTTIDVSPDNRALTVTGTTVNEASPYVQFQVGGASEQWVSLALGTTGSGTGHATMGVDFLPNLQYFNGTSWVDYTGGFVQIPSGSTTLLVRTPVLQDRPYEGSETLKLTAYNQSQWESSTGTSGNSTIVDDGTGDVYLAGNNTSTPSTSGTSGYPSHLDDDRPVTVDSIVVNEASPWAMFTITGNANQVLSLALSNGTATVGDGTPDDGTEDYSPDLQYWNGSAWAAYNGTSVTMTATTLLVRTAVHQDTLFEGQHVFNLGVTKQSSNTTVYGSASIYDDGTGKIYAFDNVNDGTATITTGPGAGFDDDRTLTIDSPLVNEGSDYVVFTLNGNSGQTVSLQLQDESSNGTVSGKANILENQILKIWDGVAWVNYDANNLPTFDGNGKIFVRVDIIAEQDAPYEGAETFKLNATLTGQSTAVTGVATIIDDGTGVKYPGTFTNGSPATSTTDLDNDQLGAITVTGGNYNENSPRAVFTVNANPGQVLTLDVQNAAESGKAPTGDNEGKPNDSLDTANIYYSLDGGATWQLYTGPITAGSVPVLVAVDITNERDDVYEGEEQLKLVVTSGSQSVSGYASIFDDGTGTVTKEITQLTTNDTGANDPTVAKDDDRPKPAAPLTPPASTPTPPATPLAELAPPPAKAGPTQAFSSALTPLAPALVPADPPLALIDAITSGSGFQIPVSESAPPGLSLYQGITDQFVQSTNVATKVSLPFDAFVHSNKDAVIKLEAKQGDNSNLPKWVQFDPASGTFEVTPPKGFKGKLNLKVIARDDDGREAVAMFQMFIGEQQTPSRPQTRESFSDKLRMAGKRPVTLVRVSDASHKPTARDAMRTHAG